MCKLFTAKQSEFSVVPVIRIKLQSISQDDEFTPRTCFVIRMSEKFKIGLKGKILRRRSHASTPLSNRGYVE